MKFFIFSIRLVCLELVLLLPLTFSTFSQDRDSSVRRCLSITDVNERVECLETGVAPNSGTQLSNPTAPKLPRANPSFDCRAARNSIERAICADATLSDWDSRMGQLLQQTLRRSKDSQPILDSQRLWLTERDNRCGTVVDTALWSCLLEMTKLRAAALANGIAISADATPPTQTSLAPTTTTTQSRRTEAASSDAKGGVPAPSSTKLPLSDSSTSSQDGGSTFVIALIALVLGLIIFLKVFRHIRTKQLIAAEQQRIEEFRIAEEQRLISRYGHEIAARILARQIWQGMTDEQLVESRGHPADVGREIIRSNRRETWKYGQTGRNRFNERVYLENGIVIGWKN